MTTHVTTPRHQKGDRFLSDLRYENIVARAFWWSLRQDLIFFSARIDDTVIVPAGTALNLTSIPRILWNAFPPHSPEYAPAAAVHDWHYRNHQVSRRTADLIFRDGMKVLGVSWWKRNAFYFAVRIGGRGAYKRST